VNLTFAAYSTADGAAELLNSMARAKNHCARPQYELALEQYKELIGLPDEGTAQRGDEARGVSAVLNPHYDLSPLAGYVVPPFQGCGPGHIDEAKIAPDKANRSRLRWSKR
jgi:hypothetical protein